MGHDALLLAKARQVLGAPGDDGRSSYQVSLHVCSECGRAEQVASGEPVAVEPAVLEMAECDAQHLGHLGQMLAPATPEGAAKSPRRPSPRALRLFRRARAHRAHRAHRETDAPPRPAKHPAALRRAVLQRDRHRCQAPGCTHSMYVDVHQVQRRADGGPNVSGNAP